MKVNLPVKFIVAIVVVALLSGTALPIEATLLPTFERFVKTVSNGQAGVVRGVYVSGVLALPVRQQPSANQDYVAKNAGVATQFGLAAGQDVIGLLAHNYLAGRSFFDLAIGVEVRIVYGDGAIGFYTVSDIYQYRTLESNNTAGDLVDLSTGLQMSVVDVFNVVYGGSHHVTFQTCIKKNGNLSWGRFFVVATPTN